MRLISIPVIVAVLAGGHALALVNDDAYVLGKKHLETEFWAEYLSAPAEAADVGQFTVIPRYGVLSPLDLRLFLPLVGVFPPQGEDEMGLGDVGCGAKLLIYGREDSATAVGVTPYAVFPTGDEKKGLGSGATAVGSGVIVSFGIGERMLYHINGNFNYAIPEEGEKEATFSAGFAAEVPITDRWGCAVEYVSEFEKNEQDEYPANAAVEFNFGLTPQLEIDAGTRVGLGANEDAMTYYVGCVWTAF